MYTSNSEQEAKLEKPKHNIFSSENYGIGRLEFIGCLILISAILYIVAVVIGFLFGTIGIDKVTITIIGNIIFWLYLLITLTNTYAHRLYHIGWTDDMNSKSIAGLIIFILVTGSFIPVINIFAGLVLFVFTLILTVVPGSND